MNEEVGRVVRGLHGEQQLICFDPLHGESCHPDELNESNRNSYLLMGDAISVLENLAAENELLKARCEAAERDMKLIADNMDGCTYILPCGLCAKNNKRCDVSDTCFEWRGTPSIRRRRRAQDALRRREGISPRRAVEPLEMA